jgi:hypothetical protein
MTPALAHAGSAFKGYGRGVERWQRAVAAVERRADRSRGDALDRLAEAVGWSEARAEQRASQLCASGRVTLNFHPDRMDRAGRTVAGGLAADGRYRSQWATWISNGGRSAVTGGERQRWERELFAGSYDGAPEAVERPVYGALDLLRDPHGGSPRFGSSYLVLVPAVLDRVTLCVGDSHVGPDDVATAARPLPILAGLVEQARAGRLLGRPLGIADLEAVLTGRSVLEGPSRDLDHYVEAQVHGGVDLSTEVEAVVVDPSFRGTEVEADLEIAAGRAGFEVRWHRGSELPVERVPDDYRGPTMPELARTVAVGGVVDARAIGLAATDLDLGPPRPAGDGPRSLAQQLKYLWHTVLAKGRDAADG